MIALGISGAFFLILVALVIFFVTRAWFGLPINAFGINDGPEQPINFPHTTHVEQLGLDCTFCHRLVTEEKTASIPPVEQCMFCHNVVGQGLPEIEKLKDLYHNNEDLNWVRVHRLPDHVRFVHEAHITFFSKENNVSASEVCSICHGDVASMSRVEQVRPLKMGDCVDCHKNNSAPTDCTTCHY